jgi:site-specific recombinase XerD
LDGFTDWLAGRGYLPTVIQEKVRDTVHFAAWTLSEGIDDLDEVAHRRYLEHLEDCGCLRYSNGRMGKAGGRWLVEWLVECGVVADAREASQREPQLLREYFAWMRDHRGARDSTIEAYRPEITRLIEEFGDRPEAYEAKGIRSFVLGRASEHGPATAKKVVTAVRSFLRFLSATGQCDVRLVDAVPVVAEWRLSNVPRYIDAEQVERLIESCDATTPVGIRDRAVLLLLARLALRAGDIARLRLGDLDWEQAHIRVSGKSRREVRLPLPQDVGDAVIDYLTTARQDVASDCVFTKMVAPCGPMSRMSVSNTVTRALKRTGIVAPSRGAHLLRHSAATAMLREGATLHEIGAVLRHASIETTYHYAKVDVGLLRMVVLPWPVISEAPTPEVTSC